MFNWYYHHANLSCLVNNRENFPVVRRQTDKAKKIFFFKVCQTWHKKYAQLVTARDTLQRTAENTVLTREVKSETYVSKHSHQKLPFRCCLISQSYWQKVFHKGTDTPRVLKNFAAMGTALSDASWRSNSQHTAEIILHKMQDAKQRLAAHTDMIHRNLESKNWHAMNWHYNQEF